MCGIAGILFKADFSKSKASLFEKCVHHQNHRGPDNFGSYVFERGALFHQRLSILDLDSRSNQPFKDEENNSVLVYNGEVYNFKALQLKYNLSSITTSDTEIIYKLLGKCATKSIQEWNGIFAFAYLNMKSSELWLCRDRLGVKPLYFYQDDHVFLFSSEAKVIYDYLPKMDLNLQFLSEFIHYGNGFHMETFVKGVKKVQPGQVMKIDLKSFSSTFEKYFKWNTKPAFHSLSYKEAERQTIDKIKKAVKRQCISDVPVGVYLSGGIDSTALVSIASEHLGDQLSTYTVDYEFKAERGNEADLARMVAKKYHTKHHEFKVKGKEVLEDLESTILQYDYPFADPAILPLNALARLSGTTTKVILQGDGGDELFGGYGRYRELQQLKARRFAYAFASKIHWNNGIRLKFQERLNQLNFKDDAKLMAHLLMTDAANDRYIVFSPKLKEKLKDLNPYAATEKWNRYFNLFDLPNRQMLVDMKTILEHSFLEKVDKINMAHSIEARVPFLDNDLLELALAMPADQKIKNNKTKYLLRSALKNFLPEEVLQAKKMSFFVPIKAWLRHDLFDYAMAMFSSNKILNQYLNTNYLTESLFKLRKGEPRNEAELWRALILAIWLKKYGHKIK